MKSVIPCVQKGAAIRSFALEVRRWRPQKEARFVTPGFYSVETEP